MKKSFLNKSTYLLLSQLKVTASVTLLLETSQNLAVNSCVGLFSVILFGSMLKRSYNMYCTCCIAFVLDTVVCLPSINPLELVIVSCAYEAKVPTKTWAICKACKKRYGQSLFILAFIHPSHVVFVKICRIGCIIFFWKNIPSLNIHYMPIYIIWVCKIYHDSNMSAHLLVHLLQVAFHARLLPSSVDFHPVTLPVPVTLVAFNSSPLLKEAASPGDFLLGTLTSKHKTSLGRWHRVSLSILGCRCFLLHLGSLWGQVPLDFRLLLGTPMDAEAESDLLGTSFSTSHGLIPCLFVIIRGAACWMRWDLDGWVLKSHSVGGQFPVGRPVLVQYRSRV